MNLVRKKIVASMLTWVSLLVNMEHWISWPQQLKLFKHRWISLALQQQVMAWSLTRKTWMKKASQVCEWDLAVVLAC